ncbi:structural maintenance of chromosomes protein 3-like [Daucus carota subsp. sativus]|uniref:structural maintenance of chromosomes protein 3-like n=1 Tax=Daucus carota subsp. sativus TaxID=79200 RepID=UPI003083C3AA
MHIKQVIIEGFKSYREQVATEPFSSKVNCVVGANGSGKSNLFHAIRFVISDLFHNLRSDERHAFLHEGAGHQVLSAFVEIVFDNSDNRIPIEKEEVRLRRTIGLKKDEYFLDGKHITKTEVMNLLESAGFSRSNPYYVVQQGKIASLTLMKDSERLDLLKEIGGTRVYEERHEESLKIMQETGNKRNQNVQVVQYLDERLKELDDEKAELKKYNELDKQRKSLEYTIYDIELHDAKQKQAEIEDARKKVSEASAKVYNNVLDAHEKFKELDKAYKDFTKEIQKLNKEKESVEKQRIEALRKQAQLHLDDKDLQEQIITNIKAKEDVTKQLEILQKDIQKSTEELSRIKPLYNNQVMEEEGITREVMEREKRLSNLYQKQGRATQFANKAARDNWLQKEIDEYKRPLSTYAEQEKILIGEIDKLETDLEEKDAYINSCQNDAAALELIISQCHEGINQYKAQRDKLHNERKSLWKRENELSAEIEMLKAEVVKTEKSLDHATPGEIRRGLNSARRICREYGIEGVFGPLIELLDCDEKLFTAVEVTGGNSLFHVVVENDEISTQIIKHLNSLKGGRVTFIPLNRVKAPQVVYPQSADVIPLLKKLNFLPKFKPAFSQVFARTVICRDLDVATKVARTDGLDCITLEGDQVSKKGGMIGGFYDFRHSKMKFMNVIRQGTQSISERVHEMEGFKMKLQEIDQEINKLVSEQQKNDAKLAHDKSELENINQDISNANKQKYSSSKVLEKKRAVLAGALNQIDQLRARIAEKKDEMGTELVDHLMLEEKDSLSRLNSELTLLKERLISCRTNRIEVETRKSELETNLSTNLVRRKQELESIKLSAEPELLHGEAEFKRQELRVANILVDDLTQQLKRASECIEESTKKLKKINDEKTKLEILENDYQRTLQDEAKELEHLLSKRNVFIAKQQKYSKKISELGPLSSDAFDTKERKSIKDIYKMLYKCNEQLQQFSHVNKKALDQYQNFTDQREELRKRQEELNAGDEKIKELISVLDQRRDESIERTFKGVAKHFREVFSELVQNGHGHLVMIKKKDADQLDDDPDEGEHHPSDVEGRVEKYIGVKVRVSFTGQGETQSMKQLSGGQKTVVALTLIFAIQRCDAAPFYLFDEIDSALDPQYRTAVGNIVHRLTDKLNTQFIITTFRKELVKVADKIYGVTHKNMASCINVVSRKEALDFIEHDQSRKVD